MTTYPSKCRVCGKPLDVHIEENSVFTTAILLEMAACDDCLAVRYPKKSTWKSAAPITSPVPAPYRDD